MTGLLWLLALGYGVFLAFTCRVMWRRLRRPPRRTYASAVSRKAPGDPGEMERPREFREFSLDARTGQGTLALPAWEIAGERRDGPVVVCTPGWGDSKIGALVRLDALAPIASRVIAWDPPGQGEAPGLCSLGVDESRALRALVERIALERPESRIVLYGWSMGAGVSIEVAAGLDDAAAARLAGVIAEAPYRMPWTPAYAVMRLAAMPWRVNGPIVFALLGLRLGQGMRWARFDRARHAARLRCPLMVIHGVEDDICPVGDGRAIAAAAARGLMIAVERAGHNDLWVEESLRAQCAGAVRDFLLSVGRPTTAGV